MEDLPSFLRDGSSFWSVAPHKSSGKRIHSDLLGFLSVAQQYNVDLLHISWQPALQSLGGGLQTEISQSLLDLQTSFAFKRVNGQGSHEANFKAFISEVSVLQTPSVRCHPNIINLEGICWEIERECDNVWPVLVFEKAPLGDLRAFMSSSAGQSLSLLERTRLCVDIARGILALHSCNIVHGDIKPKNILVYPNDSGHPVPKVADFGYSCLGAKDTDIVKLPRTWHWQAPEWHDRAFEISAAKKTDIYSFGLLCLWVLFNDQLLETSSILTEFPEAKALLVLSRLVPEADEGSRLKELKEKDMLSNLAQKLIRRDGSTSMQLSGALEAFFDAALRCDTSARELRLDGLIDISCQDGIAEPSITVLEDPPALPESNDFSITNSLHQLCRAEYRVRSEIFKSLKVRSSREICELCNSDCLSKAAFQLAFCYRTGFGIAKDEEESGVWLERSTRDGTQLMLEIERAKNPPETWLRKGLFEQLWLQGRIRTLNFSQSYREIRTMKQVKLDLRREILDMESVFGEENDIPLHLREVLASTLRNEGLWNEAEQMEGHVMKVRRRTLGLDNEHTQRSMSKMATTYRNLGRLEEAEEIGRQVLEYRARVLGPENGDTLTSMADLAAIFLEKGNLAEAEKIYAQILRIELRLLGQDHTDTILTMGWLATALNQQGNFEDAEKLHATAAKLSARSFGPEHPSTLGALSSLALSYQSQGRWDEAQKIAEQVTKARKRILGSEHPSTLNVMSILALSLEHQGIFNDAENLLLQVLETQSHLFGRKHRSTLRTITNLAGVLTKQGRLDEAATLEEECMAASIDVLGESHPDTLTSMANLASTYRDLGRLDEAEKLENSVVQTAQTTLGKDHPSTLTYKSNLAATYGEQRRLSDAENLGREVLESRSRVLGQDHQSTIISVTRLAGVYDKLGRVQEASELRERAAVAIRKGGPELIRALGLG